MEHFAEQLEMPWLAEVKKPKDMPQEAIDRCKDALDAVIWSWALRSNRNMTQRELCERCGIQESHFSGMLNRKKYMPQGKVAVFSYAVGNNLVSQWLASDISHIEHMRLLAITEKKLEEDKAEHELAIIERKQQLLAELAELERAA